MHWRARFRTWLDRRLPPETEAEVAAAPFVAAPAIRVRRRPQIGEDRAERRALQGDGARSASPWGVLDRLLDEPTLSVPKVTGAARRRAERRDAGVGRATGGRAGAQPALAASWDGVGAIGVRPPLDPSHNAPMSRACNRLSSTPLSDRTR